MKIGDLYLNQTQMVKDQQIREKFRSLIEDASPDQIPSLLSILTTQKWSKSRIENDISSEAIEYLLDCLNNVDHEQLHSAVNKLAVQGITI